MNAGIRPHGWRVALTAWFAALGAFAWFLHVRDARVEEQLHSVAVEVKSLRGEVARLADAPPPTCPPAATQETIDANAVATKIVDSMKQASTVASSAVPPSAPEVAPDQAAALDRASAILDGAMARGKLARADVVAMRSDLAAARPEDALDLRRRIAQAINTSRLRPEDPRFIYP